MDTGSNQNDDNSPQDDSESSGLADILEVAEALGDDDDELDGDDELDSVGPSKGAAAAMVGGDEGAAAPKAPPMPPPPPPKAEPKAKAAPPPPPPAEKKTVAPPPPPPAEEDPEVALARAQAEIAKAEAAAKLAEAQAKLAEAKAKLAAAEAKKSGAHAAAKAVEAKADEDPLGALLKPPSSNGGQYQKSNLDAICGRPPATRRRPTVGGADYRLVTRAPGASPARRGMGRAALRRPGPRS